MQKLPKRLVVSGSAVLVLVVLTAGLVLAATPSVSFDKTIGPPPATKSFDISYVKNDIARYILADRTDTTTGLSSVDLFDAANLTFLGGIGQGGFVGNPPAAACAVPHACGGPNGDLIDNSNHVWVGDGPASACSAATGCNPSAAPCFAGQTTSMIKEYALAPSSGATGRMACLDTGGHFRTDEMAYSPRNNLLIAANDADGFLSLVSTSNPAIVDQFFYADNILGKTATVSGLSTPGGGIEQPVWDPQQGFFYQALPAGTSVGRVDVFNPKPGRLVYLRSINVPGCDTGPTGLALDPATHQFLGACANGVALINANNGSVSMLGTAATAGGADEIWFDSGSNAWYVSTPGKLAVVSATGNHMPQDVTQAGCCGHSVAAYTASATQSLIFDPNSAGTGISVFSAKP